jgi:hypothetical protein
VKAIQKKYNHEDKSKIIHVIENMDGYLSFHYGIPFSFRATAG